MKAQQRTQQFILLALVAILGAIAYGIWEWKHRPEAIEDAENKASIDLMNKSGRP
jgi:hypothetical protein